MIDWHFLVSNISHFGQDVCVDGTSCRQKNSGSTDIIGAPQLARKRNYRFTSRPFWTNTLRAPSSGLITTTECDQEIAYGGKETGGSCCGKVWSFDHFKMEAEKGMLSSFYHLRMLFDG